MIAIKSKKEVNYDLAFKDKKALVKIEMTNFNYDIQQQVFKVSCTASWLSTQTIKKEDGTDVVLEYYTPFDHWVSDYPAIKVNAIFRSLNNPIETTELFKEELDTLLANSLKMGIAKEDRYGLSLNDLELW